MAKTYNRLDIEINKDVMGIITAIQNDTLSRYLDVNLFDNGLPIDLTGHTVRIYMTKPDNTEIFNDGEITDAINGRVQFELTTQALAVCGELKTQIIIFDNQEREVLSTKIFKIFVTESLKNENSIESSNEYGALVVLFQNIYEALQLMTEVSQKIGLPTDKLEELSLSTMYDTMGYLIDTIEKNSTVAVQGKLKEVENKIEKLEKYIKDNDEVYYNLPNLTYISANGEKDYLSSSLKTIVNIQGSGYLVASKFRFSQMNKSNETYAIKITIDGKTIYWQEYILGTYLHSGSRSHWGGITNAQGVRSTYDEYNDGSYPSYDMKYGNLFAPVKTGSDRINLEHSKLSDKRIVIERPTNSTGTINTAHVLLNKGIRFEKSLKIEAMQRYSTGGSSLNILYSLDD